jgi:hypothetical protein
MSACPRAGPPTSRSPDLGVGATASTPPWQSSGRGAWWSDASAWISGAIAARAGEAVTGIEEVKVRPWGAVLRVRTPRAIRYFKAVGSGGRHEPRLLNDIASRWSSLVPDVLAIDEARGWILMADHGTAMNEVLDGAGQVRAVETLLPRYAEMQQATTDLVEGWRAAGTPDRSVHRMPALLEEILAGGGTSGPLPIDHSEVRGYVDALPALQRACEDLASTRVVDAIDHADMHGTNVLVDGGEPRLIDWGDACISHPFSSLLVPYELVVPLLPAGERRAAVLRLRDVYLEPWGSPTETRDAFGLAVWIGYVARAISNDHQSAGAAPGDLAPMQAEMITLLRRWLAKLPLLGDADALLM